MTEISLYPHQAALNEKCRQKMLKGKRRVLIQAATGYGKTRCAAAQLEAVLGKGKKALFVLPRRQLLEQTSLAFNELGIKHSYIAAGKPHNPHMLAFVCTAGSLVGRLSMVKPDVVFIDEAHFGEKQIDAIIEHYTAAGAYIVGLSATPWKLSGVGLGKWFDAMVCGEGIDWLIANKYLSDYLAFAPDRPDLSSIKTVAGDYHKAQLAEMMEGDSVIIGNAVAHYKANAYGKRNLTFCTSIKHSKTTADAFNAAGIPTRHVDGTTEPAELKRVLREYASGEIWNLCCAQLLQFGFDLAQASGMDDVTVEAMSDLEPTKSLAKQMQKWGRVLRRKDAPAIIHDHACNIKEHGLPDDERHWTLSDRAKRARSGKREAEEVQLRQCDQCDHVHRSAPVCPLCKHVYPIQSREVQQVDGVLAAIDKEALRKQARIEQGTAKTLDDLIKLGYSRGYKNPRGWAMKVYSARKRHA